MVWARNLKILNMTPATKIYTLCTALLLFAAFPAYTQDRLAEEEAAYIRVTNERADKIVANLDISDPDKALRVRDLIAQQYRDLSGIHDARDARIAIARKKANGEEAAATASIKAIEKKAGRKVDKLHKQYLAKLSAELSPEQVTQVKDGMTYGVLPLTYNAFLTMLPDLSQEQKERIMTYLVEAREQAMDGGSSEEKHHIFGEYKGRINNYLSAEGYDLKKASKRLQSQQ